MKSLLIVVMLVLFIQGTLNTQDTLQDSKIYKSWVILYNDPFTAKGILLETGDSTILLSDSKFMMDQYSERLKAAVCNFKNIESISIRKKNKPGNGALIGAITGFATGILIGLIDGDDPPCTSGSWVCIRYTAGQKAMMMGIPLAVLGAGLGAAIGSFRIKIPINGRIDKEKMEKLRKYSFIK